MQNPVKKVLATDKKIGLANHTVLIARDGSEYQIADSAAPIQDENEEIFGIVLIFSDVTEEYRIQEEIKRQKNFLASILEVQSGLVVLLDPEEGRIVRFNRACEKLTGYSANEVIGKKIWDILIPKEEKTEVERVFSELKAKNYPNKFKNYWVTKADEYKLISWSNNVILTNDEIEYIVGTGIDITELKNREDRIKYISYHDQLTYLYNRSYVEKELR